MTAGDREAYGDYSIDDEDQLEPGDTLEGDDVKDELDRGYSPPERYSSAQRWGNTPWEAEHAQPLADRLAMEEPETDPYAEDDTDECESPGEHEVGSRRAGRLVAHDNGDHVEQDVWGDDVGIDGAAASAEEAAMHIIDGDEDGDDEVESD
ncbi:DUF5709 domain-containing protein [Nocardioides montaniterrae]